MMSILDYGSGNILAISTLAKLSNVPYEVINSPEQIANARKILLPGVGAFDRTMATFRVSGMAEALLVRLKASDVTCMGICVGMHVLADSSEEGVETGLGLVPGRVRRFDPSSIAQKPRVPHMGWNSVEGGETHPLLQGIDREQGFYFLHSYYYDCATPDHVIATSRHGASFHAVVGTDRVFGVQFHPEKSHDNGIRLIRNFLNITPC